jgi:Xaa-Pro aminopeptidase
MQRVREALAATGVDALALSVGADLPWLTGYTAMPLERLTLLVVTQQARPALIVPRLEAPRVTEWGHFDLVAWGESQDPIALAADALKGCATVAVGDRMWARFVLDLQTAAPSRRWVNASTVTGPLRAVKDEHEIAMLAAAGAAVDEIAGSLQSGEIALCGRTEAEVSSELSQRIIAAGHHSTNFAIVAAGENAASPHHEPSQRTIGENEVVLCDFGGTMLDEWGVGYCSDITRCVWTGEVPAEAAEVYAVLQQAQAAGVAAGRPGVAAQEVDRACRQIIEAAGYGDYFIHRTGHGIGVEEHEDPYMVEGNSEMILAGHAYSVEPGIYLPDRYGFRLEDIVVATSSGPLPLNSADHRLVSVG